MILLLEWSFRNRVRQTTSRTRRDPRELPVPRFAGLDGRRPAWDGRGMILRYGTLALVAIALGSCQPLHGTDPLDSGTVSVTVVEPKPSLSEGDEASQMQEDRLKRLSRDEGYEYGSSFRGTVGESLRSEF